MFCAKCGEELQATVRTCPRCGADLGSAGAIRLTDPGDSLSRSVRRFDQAKAQLDDHTSPDLGLFFVTDMPEPATPVPAPSAPDADSAPEAGRPARRPPTDAVRAALHRVVPQNLTTSPVVAKVLTTAAAVRHWTPPAPVRAVLAKAATARDWVRDNLPEPPPRDPNYDEDGIDKGRAVTIPFLAALLALALVVTAGLSWMLMRAPDEMAARAKASTSAASAASAASVARAKASAASAAAAAAASRRRPTVTPTPTRTTPKPVPKLPAGAKNCGPGLGANASASCEFAQSLADQVDRAMTGSVQVTAYSPTSARSYNMTCVRGLIITCGSSGSAQIYIIPSN